MNDSLANMVQARAKLLRVLRDYFAHEDVTEVVTPTLRTHGVTDPNIANLTSADRDATYYLQTSPEYAMKLALADLGTSIYQICPVYRGGEAGARHNQEFQMLEWYRVGFDLQALMDDVSALMRHCADAFDLPAESVRQVSYRELFQMHLGIDPHTANLDELREQAAAHGLDHLQREADASDYLDGLFATVIEPTLTAPTIVFDYPMQQAALAQVRDNEDGATVASRFEVFARGIELGNAYEELTDPVELRTRFERNNQVRRERGLPEVPLDEPFLAAMPRMPACSGIAMGVDRLQMWLTGAETLPQLDL